MSRHSSIPTLFDECKTVSISFLKKHGYLSGNGLKMGSISWTKNGNPAGSIGISVNLNKIPFLELSYTCNGEPCKYKVQLTSRPSNLGKGVVWYFVCPETNLLCRKLYQGSKYFLHRKSFSNCFYENQVQSHKIRALARMYDTHFIADKVYDILNKKYFKRQYNGIPTKRYKKLQEILEKYERSKNCIPTIEELFVM